MLDALRLVWWRLLYSLSKRLPRREVEDINDRAVLGLSRAEDIYKTRSPLQPVKVTGPPGPRILWTNTTAWTATGRGSTMQKAWNAAWW